MAETPPEQEPAGDPVQTPAGPPGPAPLPAVARQVPAPGVPDWQVTSSWDQQEGPPPRGMSSYVHAFRRRWLLATTIGLVCGGLAGAAVLLTGQETYTAKAMVRIASREQQLVFGTSADAGGASFDVYKNTQIQLLKSRFCLIAALRDPEVAKLPLVQAQLDPVRWLAGEISVSFPGSGEIMLVGLTGEDPKSVAALVNAVVAAYMTEVVDVERAQRRERLSELDRIYTEKETEVRSKRTDLKQLAEQLGTGDSQALALKQQYALQLYTAYRTELIQLQVELRRLSSELKAQEALLEKVDDIEITESELDAAMQLDPAAVQLKAQREFLEAQVEQVREKMTPAAAHQHAQRYQKELDALAERTRKRREDLRGELKLNRRKTVEQKVHTLRSQIAVLADQAEQFRLDADSQRKEAEQFGGSSVDVEMMRAEIQHIEAILDGIANERERLKVELRAGERINPIGEEGKWASVPKAPDPQKRVALGVFATLAGLFLPIAGIVWWETRSERVNSPTEVSQRTGVEVLGAIPMLPGWAMRATEAPSAKYRRWRAMLSESVKNVTAALLRKGEIEGTQIVLVSSAVSGEGKTTLASQLALSLAQAGHRTLLADFDLRRPAIDHVFEIQVGPGVGELLRGECGVPEAVHETEAGNLWVIPAGRPAQQLGTFMANGQVGGLFEQLRNDYEFVVLDGGPILPLADTRLVAPHADAVILSILRDVSRAPKVLAACEILRQFGVRSLAAVVTGSSADIYYNDYHYGPHVREPDRDDLDAASSDGRDPGAAADETEDDELKA